MKKKIRKIIVNDVPHIWVCGSVNCDGDGNKRLKIINKELNKIIFDEVINYDVIVTPSSIKDIINKTSGVDLSTTTNSEKKR